MADCLENYLKTVQEQIRWKRAHQGLSLELRTHLLDQRDAYLACGMDEEEAQKESVRQMGDPVEVGTALDRIHRPKPQWGLLALVGILLCMGYVAQTLLREVAVIEGVYTATFYETRWLVSAAIGVVTMLAAYFLDYTVLARRPVVCFFAGCLIFGGVFCCSHRVSGRAYEIQYWMLLAPVLLAVLIYGMRGKGWHGFWTDVAATLALVALACMIPNVTLAVLILGTGLVLISVAMARGWMGIPVKSGMAVLGGMAGMTVLLFCRFVLTSAPFNRRLQMVLHPELDPLGAGYHATVIRSLLAGAKWIGQGDVTYAGFDSAERLLPSIPTDSLLTWVIHRLGWAAGLVLIGTLVLLLAWMARKAFKQKGMLGSLIAVAAVVTLTVQVVTFVVFDLGFCLTGTLSLPLISYGKGFMVTNMALIGLSLSVFREENLPVFEKHQRKGARLHDSKLIFWQDGDLVIGFRRFSKMKRV